MNFFAITNLVPNSNNFDMNLYDICHIQKFFYFAKISLYTLFLTYTIANFNFWLVLRRFKQL